jgi:PII-like signaling protein
MTGYQLTFFTQQDRRHRTQPLAEWLLKTARDLGIRGGTVLAASEGLGHDHKLHSAHLFELADQPIEITLAVSEVEAVKLMALLEKEDMRLFYVRAPIEFGTVGAASD